MGDFHQKSDSTDLQPYESIIKRRVRLQMEFSYPVTILFASCSVLLYIIIMQPAKQQIINKQINITVLIFVYLYICYMFRSSWIIITKYAWNVLSYWIVFLLWIYIWGHTYEFNHDSSFIINLNINVSSTIL
jgi:hypothetical protein